MAPQLVIAQAGAAFLGLAAQVADVGAEQPRLDLATGVDVIGARA